MTDKLTREKDRRPQIDDFAWDATDDAAMPTLD
jgi:hypothetical protein